MYVDFHVIMKRGVTVISVIMCIQIWQLSSACDVGWVGKDCKLQCHCTNNKCTDDGTCINGSRCDDEWFGPACQYQNLATVYTATLTLDGSRQTQTTVGLCNIAGANQRIEVSWNISYPFIFLWVQFKQTTNYLTSNLTINITDGNYRCDSIYQSAISQDTVEFRCWTPVNMTRLVLTGENVRNACSIYVSGGRNIAVKQSAIQDSTYNSISAASNAVDGNRKSDWTQNFCMHTGIQTSKGTPHYWTVDFSGEAYSVNRYVLYSRWDVKTDPAPCCPERISGFTLTSWNNKGDQVFTYTAPFWRHALVHTVISGSRDVARVNVTLDVEYLNFCEAEIYGVNVCPTNKYGLDCSKECNCVNNEQCHVDTGTCPSGCAPGYTFEGCQTQCSTGTWGVDCRNSCSVNCYNKNQCNRTVGTCDGGCVEGFKPPLCNEECDKRTWGVNCSKTCNSNCLNDFCHSDNGNCLNGCKQGYQGKQCSQECSAGTWGVDCHNFCSVNCSNKDSCNHKDGTCDGGCVEGFKPPLCIEVHETGENTNIGSYSKWVGLAAGLVAIAGSIAVIVIVNRKTKATALFACTKSSKPKDSETIETSNVIQMQSFPTDEDGYLMSRERVDLLPANPSSDMSPQPATRGRQQEATHRDVTATVSLASTCGTSENPYDVINEAQVSYFNYPELNQPPTEESLVDVVENLPNTVIVTEHLYNTLEDVTYGDEQNQYLAPQFV